MKTISPDVCASFLIEWNYEIYGDKNTAGKKYLLPSVRLPSGVPIFQAAFDIVSKEKNKSNAALYDITTRSSIATANKLDSTVERVYFQYSSMDLGKFVCNKYLNRTKTFSQSLLGTYSGLANKTKTFPGKYHFDISATHSDYVYELCDQLMATEMWPENNALKLSDIEFVVSGVTVDAHKAIVCARSPVFAAMFANEMLESRIGRVNITDVSVETFRLFLQFLYTGSLDESSFDEQLKYCADKYQVKTLNDLCCGLLVQQDSERCKDLRRRVECRSERYAYEGCIYFSI